jgi:hypothetical protein
MTLQRSEVRFGTGRVEHEAVVLHEVLGAVRIGHREPETARALAVVLGGSPDDDARRGVDERADRTGFR